MISTVHGWVQKQSWTEINVMPSLSQNKDVNIIWLESKEWIKFGGKAFLCFITFGRLKQIQNLCKARWLHSYIQWENVTSHIVINAKKENKTGHIINGLLNKSTVSWCLHGRYRAELRSLTQTCPVHNVPWFS